MIPVLFFFFLAANDNAEELTRAVAESGRVVEIAHTFRANARRLQKLRRACRRWFASAISKARCATDSGTWTWC